MAGASRWTSRRISRRSSRRRSSASISTTRVAGPSSRRHSARHPTFFHKPTTSLNAHGGEVVRPPRCRYLNYEGEIAIVIGERCKHIAPDEADDYILGYTVANDYGLHDFRDTDAGSMLRVKGSDTLCPLGPGLVDGLGLPRQADPDTRERRGEAGREHGRDDLGHALPGGRHRADDHAPSRTT